MRVRGRGRGPVGRVLGGRGGGGCFFFVLFLGIFGIGFLWISFFQEGFVEMGIEISSSMRSLLWVFRLLVLVELYHINSSSFRPPFIPSFFPLLCGFALGA